MFEALAQVLDVVAQAQCQCNSERSFEISVSQIGTETEDVKQFTLLEVLKDFAKHVLLESFFVRSV